MPQTWPTSVHKCLRVDWNGYKAVCLSSESLNTENILSILHAIKLYQTHPFVGVHSSLRTLYEQYSEYQPFAMRAHLSLHTMSTCTVFK